MTLIEQIKDLINRVENARNFDGSEGKWVTIHGTHIFIPEGKEVEEVTKEFFDKVGKSKEPSKDGKGGNFDKYAPDRETLKKYVKESNIDGIKKIIKDQKTRFDWAFGEDKKKQALEDLEVIYDEIEHASMKEINPTEEENLHYELQQVEKYMNDTLNKDWSKEDKSTKTKYLGTGGKSPETPKEGKRTRRAVSLEDLGLDELISRKGDKDFSGMPKDKTVKEQKLEDGINEITDEYGRTTFKKGNKWSNVMKNGTYYLAAYGLTHKTGVPWEDEKGVTEEQLLNSRGFKTEKGARKWALEQLKRLTSDNSLENAFTEALTEIIIEQ